MLRQESEGEVTQGETESFDRSNRVLPGEPFRREEGMFNWDMPSSCLSSNLKALSSIEGLKAFPARARDRITSSIKR